MSAAQQAERREFNRWFVQTFADPDHRFTHLPLWLKADLWSAWQAGRAASLAIGRRT